MKAFVDTNILAYRLDPDEPAKRDLAKAWLDREDVELVISTQVLIELHSVLSRRFRLSRERASEAIGKIEYVTLTTDRAMVLRASETAVRHQLSIFDALIVEAAAAAGCDELWTEDLTDGSTLRSVRIVNPFTDKSAGDDPQDSADGSISV